MNLSYFIARRISNSRDKSFSSTVYKIAIVSIAVGLATMIVSFLIMFGFQSTIINKIYSFSAHLQITKYTLDNSFEEAPIDKNQEFYLHPENFPYIDHIQEVGHKAGLVKANEEVMGMIIKGVSDSFDTARFAANMIEGRFIDFTSANYSREIVISRITADKLRLQVGDDMIIHFFQNPPRYRKLEVVGIYETNLADYYDDKIMIGDLRLIRRLNDWPDDLVGGFEVFLTDINEIDYAEDQLDATVPLDLWVQKVSDKYVQLFEWLFLISRQVKIFLTIILFVVSVNMISIILILIMERTQMVGLLIALGSPNALIRKIFGYNGMRLTLKGLFFGNLIGLGICLIQFYFRIIKLNPADYYMSYVPIEWRWDVVILLNIMTLAIVAFIIILPTTYISKIRPIRTIRFD